MKLTSPVAHEAFGPLSLKWHRHMGRTPTWKDETELVALLKAGVVAHGVVTALIGILFVQAAWRVNPAKAGGIGKAFSWLVNQPYGQVLVAAICVGLIAFA